MVIVLLQIVMKFWKDNGVSGFHINDMEYLAEDFSQWNEAVFVCLAAAFLLLAIIAFLVCWKIIHFVDPRV